MHSLEELEGLLEPAVLGEPRDHRAPGALVGKRHGDEESPRFVEIARPCESGYYGVPREGVPLGHSVEQLAGVYEGAAFGVGVDKSVEDECLG